MVGYEYERPIMVQKESFCRYFGLIEAVARKLLSVHSEAKGKLLKGSKLNLSTWSRWVSKLQPFN